MPISGVLVSCDLSTVLFQCTESSVWSEVILVSWPKSSLAEACSRATNVRYTWVSLCLSVKRGGLWLVTSMLLDGVGAAEKHAGC